MANEKYYVVTQGTYSDYHIVAITADRELMEEKKMKKLFISCPMKSRTKENILDSMARMHKIAEAFFGQELEVIPTYIEDSPPVNSNQSVWYLGESIKKMAEADYYIGVTYSDLFSGCRIENDVARSYGIPHTFVDITMMPDACEIEKACYATLDHTK